MEDHFHWYLRQHFVCFYVIAVLASKNLHGLILSNSLLGSWAEVAPSPLFCGKMWHSICSKPLFAQHKAQRKWRVMKNTARESFFWFKKKKKSLGCASSGHVDGALPWPGPPWPTLNLTTGAWAGRSRAHTHRKSAWDKQTQGHHCWCLLGSHVCSGMRHMCTNRRACTFMQMCPKFPDRSVCMYVC